jgi:hypothetical protein
METFRQGQQTLSRLRYQYPKDWLYVEQVDHEWTALQEVLERKSKLIADQTDALRAKITAEDGVVSRSGMRSALSLARSRLPKLLLHWIISIPSSVS